jgi:hypothetical protein
MKSISFLIILAFLTVQQNTGKSAKVSFEVVPVKNVYRPNEPISLKFILINRGEVPITIERFSPVCSSDFFAFVNLRVLDHRNQEALYGGCAGDSFLTKEAVEREASEVAKKDYWITLQPGELFGEQADREVRTVKGTYTIKSQFLPARFPIEEQTRIAQRGITILSEQIEAPSVQIKVR